MTSAERSKLDRDRLSAQLRRLRTKIGELLGDAALITSSPTAGLLLAHHDEVWT